MAKYFCPKCTNLTFALRYQTGQTWYRIEKQWCNVCKTERKESDCIKGLEGLSKKRR